MLHLPWESVTQHMDTYIYLHAPYTLTLTQKAADELSTVAPVCSSSTQENNQDGRQIDVSLHRKQFVRNREVCLEQQEARRITTPQGGGKASAGSFQRNSVVK